MAKKSRTIDKGKSPFDDGDMGYTLHGNAVKVGNNSFQIKEKKMPFDPDDGSFEFYGDAVYRGKYKFKFKPEKNAVDDDGMAYDLYGDAVAVGEDTFASVTSFSRMYDKGMKTIAEGYVRAQASADSEDADSSFAEAYTDITVIGADLTVIWNQEDSAQINGISADISITEFYAIDLPKWDGDTTVIFSDDNHVEIDGELTGRAKKLLEKKFGDIFDLDGNVALADVEATVEAENSFVDVDAYVLALEDNLSEASASITAAGSDII